MSQKRKATSAEQTNINEGNTLITRNTNITTPMDTNISSRSNTQSTAGSSSSSSTPAAAVTNKRMKHEEKEEGTMMNKSSDNTDNLSSSSISTPSTSLTSSQLLSTLKLFLSDSIITPSLNIPHIPNDLVNIIHAYADPNTKPIEIYTFFRVTHDLMSNDDPIMPENEEHYSYESAVQGLYKNWINFVYIEYGDPEADDDFDVVDDEEEESRAERERKITSIQEKYEILKIYNGSIEQENEFKQWIQQWISSTENTRSEFFKYFHYVKWRRLNRTTMEWEQII